MNKTENDDIQKLKELQTDFRSKFSVLKKAKDAFLKLFRQKLEAKKIEEIQQSISNKK